VWNVYVRRAVFTTEYVESNGEMTNACEILVGNFKDKEDNMKMYSRQTKGVYVLTGLGLFGETI